MKWFTSFTEIIQPEEKSNYDHPNNVLNENNREHIKNSKHPNIFFNGISEKNQPKYIDFLKIPFEKSRQFLSSKLYKEFPWLRYNLGNDAAFYYLLYMSVSRNKGTYKSDSHLPKTFVLLASLNAL